MNAIKTNIVNKVIGITGATNMLAEIIDAVDRATRDAHSSNKWQRDVQYLSVVFGIDDGCPSTERQATLPPQYTKIIEVLVKQQGKPNPVPVMRTYSAFLTSKAKAKAVLLGNVLHVTSSEIIHEFVVGCFGKPNTSDDAYNSWIAVDYPNVIIYNAAAQVLSDLGDTSSVVNFQLGKTALDRMILSEEVVA